jgi:hypothetical protein
MNVFLIDLPTEEVTVAAATELINKHIGVAFKNSDLDAAHRAAEAALTVFNGFIVSNVVDEEKPCLRFVRNRAELIELIHSGGNTLYLHTAVYETESEVYQHIVKVSTWVPMEGDSRLSMIAIPSRLSTDELGIFLKNHGGMGLFDAVSEQVKEMFYNYPGSDRLKREYQSRARCFNLSRIGVPSYQSFGDETGFLLLEMLVPENKIWARVGRIQLTTGWAENSADGWNEVIVKAERPKKDEPVEGVYSGQAAFYLHIPELRNANGNQLQAHFLPFCMRGALQDIVGHIHQLSGGPVEPGSVTYELRRLIRPNDVGLPNTVGVLDLWCYRGQDHLGTIRIQTAWGANSVKTKQQEDISPDYIETIQMVTFDPATQDAITRKAEQSRSRWGGRGGWEGQAPGGMGQGYYRPDMGYPQAGFPQFGMFGQAPFGAPWGQQFVAGAPEESSFSTQNFQRFVDVVRATVSVYPIANALQSALAALDSISKDRNIQEPLFYQYQFASNRGLMVRAITISGMVHFQHVFSMQQGYQHRDQRPRW